jgi:hypothetical protein
VASDHVNKSRRARNDNNRALTGSNQVLTIKVGPNNSYSAPKHCYTPHLSRSTGVFSPFQPSTSFRTPQYGISRPREPCSCVCTCTPISPPTQWPFSSLGILSKAKNSTPARKRTIDEYSDKENQSPGPSTPPPKKQKRAYAKRRTIDEKLCDIFTVIDKAGWSFADFLFYAFRHKDDKGEDIHRGQAHANTVQKFLAGYTEHTPAEILNSWFHSSDGRLDDDSELMNSLAFLTRR